MKIWTEVSADHPEFQRELVFCFLWSIIFFGMFSLFCGLGMAVGMTFIAISNQARHHYPAPA